MNTKQIGIKPDSKEGDNIFDTYFNFIEKVQLNSDQEHKHIYNFLINSLTIVERNLLDLSVEKKTPLDKIKYINNYVNKVLKEWFPILELMILNNDFIKALAYNFLGLSLSIRSKLDTVAIEKYFEYLSPSIEASELLNLYVRSTTEIRNPFKSFNATNAQTLSIGNNFHHSLTVSNSHVINELFTQANYKIFYHLSEKAFAVSLNDIQEDTQLEKKRKEHKKHDFPSLIENFKINGQKKVHNEWLIEFKTKENILMLLIF